MSCGAASQLRALFLLPFDIFKFIHLSIHRFIYLPIYLFIFIGGDDTASKCGPGYNDAKFCYPFDAIYKTAAGDITPEVISSQKNAVLKVSHYHASF